MEAKVVCTRCKCAALCVEMGTVAFFAHVARCTECKRLFYMRPNKPNANSDILMPIGAAGKRIEIGCRWRVVYPDFSPGLGRCDICRSSTSITKEQKFLQDWYLGKE